MTSNYLFHGTCLKNAKAILEHGFDGSEGEQIWSVSGGGNYFWSLKDLARAETESARDAVDSACNRAQYAGETAVLQNDCSHIVIFQVRASGVNYEPDCSCPNMDGAVVTYDPVPAPEIEKIWISNDLSYFKPFMLAATLNWKMQLRNMPDVPEALERAAEAIRNCEFDYSEYIEMQEITWEQLADW